MIKTVRKLGIKANFLNLIKSIMKNLKLTSFLKVKQ